MIKFYGYKKCSTCRKAEKYLENRSTEYEFIDITENPPPQSTLRNIAQQAEVELKKLFNTSGVQYRELKIKEKLPGMTDKEILKLLAGNGRLVKRPLITDGRKSTVGFKEEVFDEIWG